VTKFIYEIVEHDGGWAYRPTGSFPSPLRLTTSPGQQPNALQGNSGSREIQPASHGRTAAAAGTMSSLRELTGPIRK
jgi:hypothetical protein